MKKFAHIIENLVANIANFNDQASPPENWIDVSATACDIGWPMVSGSPEPPPSRWHTVTADHLGWELTSEGQALKDAAEAIPTNEEIYNETIQNFKLIKALVISLNDGSFIPGSNLTNNQLKTLIISKM